MKKIKLYNLKHYAYEMPVYISKKSSNVLQFSTLQFSTLCQIEEYIVWCIKYGYYCTKEKKWNIY